MKTRQSSVKAGQFDDCIWSSCACERGCETFFCVFKEEFLEVEKLFSRLRLLIEEGLQKINIEDFFRGKKLSKNI